MLVPGAALRPGSAGCTAPGRPPYRVVLGARPQLVPFQRRHLVNRACGRREALHPDEPISEAVDSAVTPQVRVVGHTPASWRSQTDLAVGGDRMVALSPIPHEGGPGAQYRRSSPIRVHEGRSVPRDGVVTAVDGELLHIEWSTGEDPSLVPGAGSITIVGNVSGRTAAKRTIKKRATARKAAKKAVTKAVKQSAPAKKRTPARKAAKKREESAPAEEADPRPEGREEVGSSQEADPRPEGREEGREEVGSNSQASCQKDG